MADRYYTVNYDGNGGNMIRLQLHLYTIATDITNNKTTERADLYAIVDNASYGWWNLYGSEAYIGINGHDTTQTVTFDYRSTGTKNLITSWDTEVAHDNEGKATIWISAHHYSDVGLGNASIPASTYECDTIPRYATCNQSLASKTETSITMNWSSDNTIDRVWYSTNGGTSFTLVGDVNATSGSYTISGLSANTTYSIKTRVRRKDSQLTTDSTATSVTTYKLVTQTMNSKTVNSITMNWSLDTTANYIWYSINNGSTWVAVGTVNATSGTYTISGLSPNTAYNIKTRARRSATSTTSDSVVNAITTYDIAKITGSANWFIGNNTSVSYTNPSGASISIGIYNTAGSVAYASYRTPTSSPYTFNFTATENNNLYNSIPNSTNGTVRIYLRTTVNGTSYYSTVDRTIYVDQATNKPTFTNFEFADTNSETTALTGNNQIFVKGLSQATVTISTANKAVAKNGASIVKYRITIGTKSTEVTYSSSESVSATINAVDGASISVSAIDSRGLENTVVKNATWKDYWKPTIETSTIERENGVGTKVLFNIAGKYWNDTFGSVTNRFKNLYFRYKTKSASSYSSMITITDFISYSNGNYTTISGSFLPTTHNGTTPIEFTVGIEYNIQFFVVDMTEGLTSGYVTLTLNSGIPCTDKYKDSNGDYHIGINQLAEADNALAVGGNINLPAWTNNTKYGYKQGNTVILRTNDYDTVLAGGSRTGDIYLRPNGNEIPTNQAILNKDGTFNAVNFNRTAMQQLYSSTNLDNVKDFNQVYYCNGCTNMPTTENGHLRVQKTTDNYVVQEFTGVSTGYKYSRVCNEGTWRSWERLMPTSFVSGIFRITGTTITIPASSAGGKGYVSASFTIPDGYNFLCATYSTGQISANSGLQLTTMYPASGATGSQTLYVQYYNPTAITTATTITVRIIAIKTYFLDI